MWVKSKLVLWKPGCYNLLSKKKDKKIHKFLKYSFLWKHTVKLSISRNSVPIPSLDDKLRKNFTLPNWIMLMAELKRWKKCFEIFLIDHYADDNGKNSGLKRIVIMEK